MRRLLTPILLAAFATAVALPRATPSSAQSGKKPATAPPARSQIPAAPGALAIVDGISITQVEWDRLASPYFQEVEAQAGRRLSEDEKRLLRRNLLEELIRERLWLADARRRGMKVTEAQVDARMKQSNFFKTGNKVDEAKFLAYKRSPSSNYRELRAQVEVGLLIEEYSRWMERRFAPREAELRKAFQERTAQATIRYFMMGPDAVSLEPEASARDIRAYYDAHPQEFQTADSARIQYVKVQIDANASTDAARDAAAPAAMKAASDLLQAIHSGAPVETAAKVHGGLHDSGLFRIGEPIRGLGRIDALAEAIKSGTTGEWISNPIRHGPYVVVARILERRDSRRLPFRDAIGMSKRRADQALREAELDAAAREEVRLHPDAYRVPRLSASIVARSISSFAKEKPVTPKDIDRAYDKLRRAAKSRATDPGWSDSVRAALPEQIKRERVEQDAFHEFRDVASKLKKGEAASHVAMRVGRTLSTFTLYRGEPIAAPLLVEGAFLDSLYLLRPGSVIGPRFARDSVFVVRVESLDPSFLPPFEATRTAARSNALLARRAQVEREAEAFFQTRRGDYLTKPKWIFHYVLFRKAAPESVAVPADSIAAYWSRNPLEFTEPARVRIGVVLTRYRPGDGAEAKEKARQRSLAALARIRAGESFATVAKELSEDPPTAANGGDIGEQTRGALAKEIADVAFTIPIGTPSDPIEMRNGFHVIRVESRSPERLRPLEESREEIQKVLGAVYGDSLAYEAASRAAQAVRDGASFDSLAGRNGGATRVGPVGAGEEIAGLGQYETLETDIGGLADGAVTPEPIAVGNGYMVARRFAQTKPEPAAWAEVHDRVIADYQLERRRAIADSLDQRIRESISRGADPESIFISLGGMKVSKPFGRLGPIPDLTRDAAVGRDSVYLGRIFSGRPGTVLPPVRGSYGTLYAIVESVKSPAPTEFARRRDELWHELVDQRAAAWTDRLRSRASIRVLRPDLKSLLG
ncbi:MAG TPA: peptidyl-prolyl cis-trans isomerase [Candidatus Eisenbacteria bacterium]|nr:peptidyl-prolyl cis-trans isomerase [Candidatus Eisenbacteria bacterium]